MPQENCDTGRAIHANKRSAEDMVPGAGATRCHRCKGWHNNADRPKNRVTRTERQGGRQQGRKR